MRRDSDGFGCINQVTVGTRYAKRLQIAYIYTNSTTYIEMTTNIKKQAFSELDTGLRSELSGRLLHTARWLRGPLFCFDPFCSVWLFQRPWSGNARWKHQGKKYQEIHINPLALEDAALCVFDVLKEVQMQLTPGGPGHVSRSRPF